MTAIACGSRNAGESPASENTISKSANNRKYHVSINQIAYEMSMATQKARNPPHRRRAAAEAETLSALRHSAARLAAARVAAAMSEVDPARIRSGAVIKQYQRRQAAPK